LPRRLSTIKKCQNPSEKVLGIRHLAAVSAGSRFVAERAFAASHLRAAYRKMVQDAVIEKNMFGRRDASSLSNHSPKRPRLEQSDASPKSVKFSRCRTVARSC
jgi:hypothetical protein